MVTVFDSDDPAGPTARKQWAVAVTHMPLLHFSSRLILSDSSFLWEQGERQVLRPAPNTGCFPGASSRSQDPDSSYEASGEALTSSHKDVGQVQLSWGCSVNKPPPSTSATHRHQPQPKSIDEKQFVISKPHCFGYVESKNTEGNTDVVRSPHFLEPSYLWKSCLISLKVSISCAAWSCLRKRRCVAWRLAWPRQLGRSSRRLSWSQAAARLMSPHRKVLVQLFQITPTHTQSPCFVIKTRRTTTSKGILPISFLTYSAEVTFKNQNKHPKTAHQNNEVAKKLI